MKREEEGKEHYFFFSFSSLHSFRLKEMKWRRLEMNYAVSIFLTFAALSNQTFITINE